MNEPVIAMIEKIHARLNDLTEVVKEIPFELNGYDQKLDRIDDQVYLIEVTLEKKLKNSIKIEPISEDEANGFSSARENGVSKGEDSLVEPAKKEDSAPENTSKEGSTIPDSADDEEEGFLTDSAKEKIAGATKTINTIYREGKETFGDLSEAFGDIKDAFGGTKGIFRKR